MNPLLSRLQPYPFERLRKLFAGVQPPAGVRPISLGIGEPRHATPAFIEQALSADLGGLAKYPATADRKSTRLNSSHLVISYAVFCLKKKKNINTPPC